MFINRRAFVHFTVASGASATLAGPLAAFARARPLLAKPMHILILGGTGFLGPATIEAALARGHTVTIFNRGRTEKRRREIGRELPFMDNVETLYGNRDPEKHADDADPESPKGLSSLIGRTFDAVIDNSGYVPRIVKASAELLAPHTKQYVFISSISRYADNSRPGTDETAPAATMSDPTVEDMGAQFENYGPLKALCEDAAEQAMPGRVAVVRPGYIVGPGDPTPRFTYWPVRLSRASGERAEVAVPGAPDDPVQIIDVRDLGDWLITLVETGTTGAFNACGPEHKLTAAALMAACREAAGATNAVFTHIPADFLESLGQDAVPFPILIPPVGEYAGFHAWSNARAVRSGLKFRPVADTCRDTLAWFNALPEESRSRLEQGFPPSAAEQRLLKSWHEHSG